MSQRDADIVRANFAQRGGANSVTSSAFDASAKRQGPALCKCWDGHIGTDGSSMIQTDVQKRRARIYYQRSNGG